MIMLIQAESSGIVDGDAVLIIPGQPIPGILEDLGRVFLQGREVIEGVDLPQVAGVDQAHEHIADEGAMLGFLQEGVFPIENRLLQSPLTKIMPTAGLCRVDVLTGAACVGSLIFSTWSVGIIKGFRGR